MDVNDYQGRAISTAVYPASGALDYCTMKLCGEAGEHAEKRAKFIRGDHDGKSLDEVTDARLALVLELGDVLWYVANLAYLYGYTLNDVAEMNLKKLRDRKERGTLKGAGDDR